MRVRGPKVICEKSVPVTERELRTGRRNVAHLIMSGENAVTAERDRKAVLIALSRKRGVSAREIVDMAIDALLAGVNNSPS
jgi:hypothetical protein